MPPRRVATLAERGDHLVLLSGKVYLCALFVCCDLSATIIDRTLRATHAMSYLYNLPQ